MVVKPERVGCVHHQVSLLRTLPDFAKLVVRYDQAPAGQLSLVVQQFVPHHPALFKCYLMGGREAVVVLRGTLAPDTTATGDVGRVSKDAVDSTEPGVAKLAAACGTVVAERVRAQFPGLELLNFDCIVSASDNHAWVVDVNEFPGFPFPGSGERMVRFLGEVVVSKHSLQVPTFEVPTGR